MLTEDAPCVPGHLAARDRRKTKGLLREEHPNNGSDADATGDMGIRRDRDTSQQPEAIVSRCLQHAFKRWQRAEASVAAASRPMNHSEGLRRPSSAEGRQRGACVPARLESAGKGSPMAGEEELTPQAPLGSPTTRRHSFHGVEAGPLRCKANLLSKDEFPPRREEPSLLPVAPPEVGRTRPSPPVGASSRQHDVITTTVDRDSFRGAHMLPSRSQGGYEEPPRQSSVMLRLDTVSEEVATPAVESKSSRQESGGREGNVVPPPLVASRSLLSAPADVGAKGWDCPYSPMPEANGNVSSECKTNQTTGRTNRESERGVNGGNGQVPGRFVAGSRYTLTVLEGYLHGDGSVRDRRASNGGSPLHARNFKVYWHPEQTGGVSTKESSACASTATTPMPPLVSHQQRRPGNNIPAHFAGVVTGQRVAGAARCSNPLLHPHC